MLYLGVLTVVLSHFFDILLQYCHSRYSWPQGAPSFIPQICMSACTSWLVDRAATCQYIVQELQQHMIYNPVTLQEVTIPQAQELVPSQAQVLLTTQEVGDPGIMSEWDVPHASNVSASQS